MPILTKEDNLELLKRYKNGETKLKEKIINNNMTLVYSLVNKYKNNTTDKEDLIQIGCIGLMKAIENFDESFNVQFSTYAVPLILGEIKKHFRDEGIIKVSRGLKELSISIHKLKNSYFIENGKEISIDEIATQLKITKYDVLMALESSYMPRSLEEIIYDNENPLTIQETIKDESQENIVNLLTLKEGINLLSDREKLFINLRYYKDMNQQEIADKFNVSQVQISRLEKKIIEKLKKCF